MSVEEQDLLSVEERLQIRAGGRSLAVTKRSLGDDVELAAGFLFTDGRAAPFARRRMSCVGPLRMALHGPDENVVDPSYL
jgi:FdhD protein